MVKIQGISKRYGSKKILTDVSFSARPGEQIAIIGRNGCGKSTLLKILAGIEKPDAGSLEYYGKNPMKKGAGFRRLCGYVPQENPLMEELTVKDNLLLWGGKQCLSDQQLRSMFELDEIMKVRVSRLSGGMKRRVSIACAIAQWPPVLFMDEPTSAVDLYYRNVIHQWMQTYVRMNGILILSTHDQQEIQSSHRCMLLWEGKMQELSENERSLSEIFDKIKKETRE